ncbi:MAG: hypothetical protein M1824_000521 [Vezdaea acicularis]|nr:MAG: hypothetical protein M1824_000521 [Vezdaea acicularis]
MAVKRLQKELQDYQPSATIPSLRLINDNLFHWEALLLGPYGGLLPLHLTIPSDYPLHAPTITFSVPVAHANVHPKTGEICLDLLKEAWTPAYTLVASLEAVHWLLGHPEWESPLNVEVGGLLRSGDVVAAEALGRWSEEEFGVKSIGG